MKALGTYAPAGGGALFHPNGVNVPFAEPFVEVKYRQIKRPNCFLLSFCNALHAGGYEVQADNIHNEYLMEEWKDKYESTLHTKRNVLLLADRHVKSLGLSFQKFGGTWNPFKGDTDMPTVATVQEIDDVVVHTVAVHKQLIFNLLEE